MGHQSASEKLRPWNASALADTTDNSEYKEQRQHDSRRFASKSWVPRNQTMRPWNVAAVMNTETQPEASSSSEVNEFNYVEERRRLQQDDNAVHDTITRNDPPHMELELELVADSNSFYHVQNVVSNTPTSPTSQQDLRSSASWDCASNASSSRRKRSKVAGDDLPLTRLVTEKAKIEMEIAKRKYELQLEELHDRLRSKANDEDDNEEL